MKPSLARGAAACVFAFAGATGVAQAQTLDGFTPGHAALQRDYETRFQEGVNAGNLRALNRSMSRRASRSR